MLDWFKSDVQDPSFLGGTVVSVFAGVGVGATASAEVVRVGDRHRTPDGKTKTSSRVVFRGGYSAGPVGQTLLLSNDPQYDRKIVNRFMMFFANDPVYGRGWSVSMTPLAGATLSAAKGMPVPVLPGLIVAEKNGVFGIGLSLRSATIPFVTDQAGDLLQSEIAARAALPGPGASYMFYSKRWFWKYPAMGIMSFGLVLAPALERLDNAMRAVWRSGKAWLGRRFPTRTRTVDENDGITDV